MRKMMLFAMACAITAVFCGCASIQEVKPENLNGEQACASGTTIAHLYAENWGIYLFCIPIFTGSTEKPGSIEFFKDTVRAENVVRMLTAKSAELGASQTLNLYSHHNSYVWFFGIRDVEVSANAVK